MRESSNYHTAIWLRLLAAFLFACTVALVLVAGREVQIGQVIFWRGAFAVPVLLAYLWVTGELGRGIQISNFRLHAIRASLGILAIFFSYAAFIRLSVSMAVAISHLAPIFSVFIACIWLRDRTGWIFLSAAGIAAVGVTLIAFGTAQSGLTQANFVGICFGIAGAITAGICTNVIRTLTQFDSPGAIALVLAVTCCIMGLASWPFGWSEVSLRAWFSLAACGVLAGIGHIAMTEALARAPVSVVAPLDNTSLLWGLFFDVAVLGAQVPGLAILGCCCVGLATAFITLGPWITEATHHLGGRSAASGVSGRGYA